jgi:tetratricopeptide (TPR) repeat protein
MPQIRIDKRELKTVAIIWAVLLGVALLSFLVLHANATRIINHIEYVKAPRDERAFALYAEASKHVTALLEEAAQANRDATQKVLVSKDNPHYGKAIELYERAFMIDPHEEFSPTRRPHYERLANIHEIVGADAEQRHTLARALLAAGSYADAAKYTSALLAKNQKDIEAIKLRFEALVRVGDAAGSETAISQFVAAGGAAHTLHAMRGRLAILRKDPTRAITEFAAALNGDPKNIDIRKQYSELLRGATRDEEAAAVLREGLQFGGNDDANYLHRLGMVLLALKQNEEALAVLERAAAMARYSPDVFWELARAYQRLGKTARSNDAMQEAMRLNPDLRNSVLEQ